MAKKMLQTRFRANPNPDGSYGDHQGAWTDEGEFSFNKHGEISSAGSKFLRSIDRDRYEIRWVPVTKKTKVDEAAILNVQTSEAGMTGETTFVADDTVALAQLLKSAGLESKQFNGPATLSVEVQQGTASVTSRINAPDLRSIMKLLEPEFQAAGDLEAGVDDMSQDMEVPTEEPCVDGACDAPVDAVEPEVDMGMDLDEPVVENEEDDTFDILYYVCGLAAEGQTEGNEEFNYGHDLANLFWKAVKYVPDNYDVDDAALNAVKALAGSDDPIDYGYYPDNERGVAVVYAVSLVGEVDESTTMQPYPGIADRKPVQPKTKMVPARSGDNPLAEGPFDDKRGEFSDTEQGAIDFMKFMSSHDMTGATAQPDPVVDGVWLVSHPAGKSIVYLNDMDFEDIDESVKPKSFMDYVKEAELRELSGDLKGRYAAKAQAEKSRHEKRAGELDDLVRDANNAEKMGIMRKGAGDRVAKWRDAHDRTAWKREKGLDRINGYQPDDLMDEFHMTEANADWQRKTRQFGEPYYLNTDCGYASLESIMQGEGYFDDMEMGLAQHSTKVGFTILEIDRNGKKGYNFVNSPDTRLQPGTPVTCITQTSNGNKFRPGKFIASFTAKDLSLNYDQVVAELAKLGITPSKKLSVKTFD